MGRKSAALVEALTGRFTDHHAFMMQLHLDRIDQIEATLAALDAPIDRVMEPVSLARELLMTVPGISKNVANVIIAEAGVDMSVFDTAGIWHRGREYVRARTSEQPLFGVHPSCVWGPPRLRLLPSCV